MHPEDAKPLIWSAVGGALAAIFIGFMWGGWMTTGGARELAALASAESIVARLAPICVVQIERDPEKESKLAALRATQSWRRGDYVAQNGWATMPGESSADTKVAERCAELALPAGA